MGGYLIRPAVPADVDMMSAIERVCFTVPWSRDSIEHSIRSKNSYCVSVILDGVVVAYGISHTASDEGEILNLVVSPKHRRRGLGRAILSDMLKVCAARGAKNVYLEVRESNTGASALYEKAGFAVTGRRKNYYKYPTEDAVLMAKSLSGGDDNDNSCD